MLHNVFVAEISHRNMKAASGHSNIGGSIDSCPSIIATFL
jgi:hypothetical protein